MFGDPEAADAEDGRPTIQEDVEARDAASPDLAAARRRAAAAYREARGLDPYVAPHADEVLEGRGVLGTGGFGVVERVHDRRLAREAARKRIRAAGPSDIAVRRFRWEAEITARLEHPSIPAVYEAGTDTAGRHYMLMRLVEGEPLSARIPAFHRAHPDLRRAGGALRELLVAALRIGETVAYAHDHGVLHRDLKPANVMVGRFGEVLVMDWGLARELGGDAAQDAVLESALTPEQEDRAARAGLTLPGTLLGTLGYAAPEQVRGEPVDERADVFGLGAILAEVLSGEPPVEGSSFVEMVVAAGSGRVVLPQERRDDVPPELASIAARALAPDRDARYPSAAAFVADLQAYLAGEDVAAHRYGPLERLGRAPRRYPRGAVALVVALLGAALASVLHGKAVAEEHWREAEEQRARAEEHWREAEEQRARAEEQRARAEEQRERAERVAAELARQRASGGGEGR